MACNEQGFVQAWNLKNVCPEPLLIENKCTSLQQKFSDACQARTEANSEQMPKFTTSCHACTKPHVGGSYSIILNTNSLKSLYATIAVMLFKSLVGLYSTMSAPTIETGIFCTIFINSLVVKPPGS